MEIPLDQEAGGVSFKIDKVIHPGLVWGMYGTESVTEFVATDDYLAICSTATTRVGDIEGYCVERRVAKRRRLGIGHVRKKILVLFSALWEAMSHSGTFRVDLPVCQ
jgi:hypothetical protein